MVGFGGVVLDSRRATASELREKRRDVYAEFLRVSDAHWATDGARRRLDEQLDGDDLPPIAEQASPGLAGDVRQNYVNGDGCPRSARPGPCDRVPGSRDALQRNREIPTQG